MTILDKDRQIFHELDVLYSWKKGGEFMRIPNLIMQSLIAGAVLFIPAEVFAEKENTEKRNPAAERNRSAVEQGNQAAEQLPEQAEKQTEPTEKVSRPQPSLTDDKQAKVTRPDSKGSQKSSEVRQKNAAAETKPSQKTQNQSGIKKQVPQRPSKKNVPMNQSQIKKAETSEKVIHRKAPLSKSALSEETVKKYNGKKFTAKKDTEKSLPKKAVTKSPQQRPSHPVSKHPISKAIPAASSQSSSPSSSNTDVGTGNASLANFKANLVLPLIFAENERVSVYFSRMDLLRSQWVNAPPSKPPEAALKFFKKIV